MKIFERWNAMAIAVRIEYHWWWVLHWRKRGNRMLDKGISLHSSALLDLNRRINKHSLPIYRLTREYKHRFLSQSVVHQK